MKIKLELKDTAKTRLQAIEGLVGGDYGLDAEWAVAFAQSIKKASRKDLEKAVVDFGRIINDCYVIAHGWNSKCCRGKGKEFLGK
jgi:hypothetical protein